MIPILSNIDILRISGVHSILGLELTDSAVKLLELAKQGSPFTKYKCRLSVKASFIHEFSSSETKGVTLGSALQKSGFTTRKAVIGVHSQSLKIVETEISPATERVSDWISDHQDDLLKLPIPPSELTFVYHIIDSSSQGIRVRITFARTSMLQEIRDVVKLAGLDLVGIHPIDNKEPDFGFVEQISNLNPDYKSCAHLAISGFFPETAKTSFLNESERASNETKVYKSLFQRTVIGVGAALILLLFLPFAARRYLEIRETHLEDQLLSIGPVYSEVQLLENQVQELEQQLSGGSQSIRRSEIAKVLFDIARSSPSDLWLSRLSVSNEGPGKQTVTLTGYAKGSESISEFMREIKEEGVSKDVRLVRSETLQDRAQGVQVKNMPRSFVAFELRLELSS